MTDTDQPPQAAVTIARAIELYLESLRSPNSERTVRTYRTALRSFCAMLATQAVDPAQAPAATLDIQAVDNFIAFLGEKSAATETIYLTALRSFFAFLEDEGLASPNLGKVQRRIQKRARKSAWSPEVFPREQIMRLIGYAQDLAGQSLENTAALLKDEAAIRAARKAARLRNLRDRALILILADTGLRVAEACSLTYGNIDALEFRLRDVRRKGYKRKGLQQGASVLVSERALAAVQDYQEARKDEDRPAGMKKKSVPLFIRHDPAAKEIQRISEKTAWEIVKNRTNECLGPAAAEQIHPHSFRHYFVTVVLLETDLETARRLAGHASPATTSRYAEIDPEVEERYHKIFNRKDEK